MVSQEADAKDLIARAQQANLELFLWNNRLVWRREAKAPLGLKSEISRHIWEIKRLIVERYMAERNKPNVPHKWVVRLGDDPSAEKARPAYLACGPASWFTRMLQQAHEFGSESERLRWLVLEQDQVGGAIRADNGILVASLVRLPEGCELGGPKGSQAEILSACEACMAPPVADDRIEEILKNETD